MIVPGSPLKTCAGSFDATAPTRPESPYITNPNTPYGGTFETLFAKYQTSSGLTNVPVTTNPKKAPYATLHWLIRNGQMPLIGQGTIDADGVEGYSIRSAKGWAQAGRIIRVPKSLVVCCALIGAELVAAVQDQYSQLDAIGVDVYFNFTPGGGFSRFSSCLPVVTAQVVQAASSAGLSPPGAYPAVGYVTPAAATDLNGGLVMFAGIGSSECGYQIMTGVENPGYLWVSAAGDPIVPATNIQTNLWAFDEIAASEAALAIQVAARCQDFRFDIYGDTDRGVGSITVYEADARFRNGVPGAAYQFGSGSGYSPDYTDLATQLVENALTFFS